MANKQNKKKNGQLTVYKQNKPVNKANNNEKAVTKYVQEKPVKRSKGGTNWVPFLVFLGVFAAIVLICLCIPGFADETVLSVPAFVSALGTVVTGIAGMVSTIIGLFKKD